MLLGAVALIVAACAGGGPEKPLEDPFYVQYKELAVGLRENKTVHGPVKDNQCSACHVDVEDVSKIKGDDPDLCVGCHTDRKADMEKEHVHAAVLGGCMTCHDKHGSDNPYMLSSSVKELCTMCHDITDEAIKKGHKGIETFSGECTDCHSPHGSKNPKLIWENGLHGAFEGGMCDSCHDPEGDGGKPKMIAETGEMCGMCHGDKVEEKEYPHAPVMGGDCTMCHNPHRSIRYALLVDRTNDICRMCHSDVPKVGHPLSMHPTEKDGVMNPRDAKKPFGCDSCHDPHGNENPRFKRKPNMDICQWCHQK